MKWDKFCIDDKIVFIGDPDRLKNPRGKTIPCCLVFGQKYKVNNIFFWGRIEMIRLSGDNTFYMDDLFVSKREWKKINKIVSNILN